MKSEAVLWVVTRQCYWPDGDNVVEIAEGGLDYANPDALCAKYDGEFEEFTNPLTAVEAAIGIVKAWRSDAKTRKIALAIGNTMGYTMPFEHIRFRDARAWAKHVYAKLPKCSHCGELFGKERYHLLDYDDAEFCSEYCAEEAVRFYQEQNAPDEESEEDE